MQPNNRGGVIAVGGNALIREKSRISTNDQSEAIRETCAYIADIVEQGAPGMTVGKLAADLKNSNIWYFWWD